MNRTSHVTLVLLTLCLGACSSTRVLVETPNLYLKSDDPYTAHDIPAPLQSNTAKLFYVTDRLQKQSAKTSYLPIRSASMAFGMAEVVFGENSTWETLRRYSSIKNRPEEIPLKLRSINELIRFPETPLPLSYNDGRAYLDEKLSQSYATAAKAMQRRISEALQNSNEKEIIFFLHGYNNSFSDAAFSLADLWHFTERHSVPIFYSWPAAHGGLFGYFADSESGEFSIFHLKETLRILSQIPELRKIHVIAHSRGTVLATSAIRELVIEARGTESVDARSLKIDNVILAAPDLDVGVVQQRLAAERIESQVGQVTVYMNEDDGALRLSQILSASRRLGRLTEGDMSARDLELLARIPNVSFIHVEGVSSFLGHSYYRKNPNALSDIAILVTKGTKPGEKGRPLEKRAGNFWTMPESYPLNEQ